MISPADMRAEANLLEVQAADERTATRRAGGDPEHDTPLAAVLDSRACHWRAAAEICERLDLLIGVFASSSLPESPIEALKRGARPIERRTT